MKTTFFTKVNVIAILTFLIGLAAIISQGATPAFVAWTGIVVFALTLIMNRLANYSGPVVENGINGSWWVIIINGFGIVILVLQRIMTDGLVSQTWNIKILMIIGVINLLLRTFAGDKGSVADVQRKLSR